LRFPLGNQALDHQAKLALGLAALVIEHRPERLEQSELHDRRIPRRALDETMRDSRQLGARIRRFEAPARFLCDFRRPALRRSIELVDELLLAGEVPVNRSLRGARFLRDLRGGRDVITARREQLERGPDQALACEIGGRRGVGNVGMRHGANLPSTKQCN